MELVSHSAAVNCHLLTNLTVEHDENPLCVSFSPKCSVFWWEPVHSLVSSSREVAAYFNETGHPPFLHQGPLSQLASRQVGRVFERPKKIQLNLSLFHFAFPASGCDRLRQNWQSLISFRVRGPFKASLLPTQPPTPTNLFFYTYSSGYLFQLSVWWSLCCVYLNW